MKETLLKISGEVLSVEENPQASQTKCAKGSLKVLFQLVHQGHSLAVVVGVAIIRVLKRKISLA